MKLKTVSSPSLVAEKNCHMRKTPRVIGRFVLWLRRLAGDKTISRQHFKRRNNAAGWIIYVSSTSMDLSRTLAPSRSAARSGSRWTKNEFTPLFCRWNYSLGALCFQIEGIMWVSCFYPLWFVKCVIPSSSRASDAPAGAADVHLMYCKLLVVASVAVEVHILRVKALSSLSSSDSSGYCSLQGKGLIHANKCNKNIQGWKKPWAISPPFKALCLLASLTW